MKENVLENISDIIRNSERKRNLKMKIAIIFFIIMMSLFGILAI